jgi:hypothetical protein
VGNDADVANAVDLAGHEREKDEGRGMRDDEGP